MPNLQEQITEILNNLDTQKPQEIGADEPIVMTNINHIVASIEGLVDALRLINTTTPALPLAGYKYWRFPGDPLPWNLHTATHPDDWTKLHERYPGVALRMAGGNASQFKSNTKNVSYDSATQGNGGGQMPALQDHVHNYEHRTGSYRQGPSNFNCSGTSLGNYKTGAPLKNGSDAPPLYVDGTETRMKNITVEVYAYKESEYPTT